MPLLIMNLVKKLFPWHQIFLDTDIFLLKNSPCSSRSESRGLSKFMPSENFIFVAALFAAAVALSPVVYSAEKYYGVYDDGRIVIDEVIGCMIACSLLPKTPLILISAFILFRFFDIVKPGIIRTSQEIPYGFGVMVDDVLAGISANLCAQALNFGIKYFS